MNTSGDIAAAIGRGEYEICSFEQTELPGSYVPSLRARLPKYFNHSSSLSEPLSFKSCVCHLKSLEVQNPEMMILNAVALQVNELLMKNSHNQSKIDSTISSKKEALDQGNFSIRALDISDDGKSLHPRLIVHYKNGSYIGDQAITRRNEMSWEQILSLYPVPDHYSPRKLLSPRTRRKAKNENKELKNLSDNILKKLNFIFTKKLKQPQHSIGSSFEYSE